MPNQIELSAAVEADLSDIFLWGLATYGEAQARVYASLISGRLDTIKEFPKSYAEDTDLKPPQHVAAVGQHIILYANKGSKVFVTRIRHHAEDWR